MHYTMKNSGRNDLGLTVAVKTGGGNDPENDEVASDE